MSFQPANRPPPVIKSVSTSYVVDQSEIAVEGSTQAHPLGPPPLTLKRVRAGVSRTPVRSTPVIEPTEGKQGAATCKKQELNAPLLKRTRGIVKPAKKFARVRRTFRASAQPRRTWPVKQASVVESTALVPYKNEIALVPYKKPSSNLRTKVAPVFTQFGPVLQDIVLSLAVDQLTEICCPALPVVQRGPTRPSRMLASTSMVAAPRANHFQQARKTAAQIVAGEGYTVTKPSPKSNRLLKTFKCVTAGTPIMSGVYVAQTDIVAALTRYHHEKPYVRRQAKVKECIEQAGRVSTDFNRHLKDIQTCFSEINAAFNSPDALNEEHALPKLIFASTTSNEAGGNLQARPAFLVFPQGQPQNGGIQQLHEITPVHEIVEAQQQMLRPDFVALMNQASDKFRGMLSLKMRVYETEKQNVPVKYILGLDQEVFESVHQISQTLDEILTPAKDHKASLQRRGHTSNMPIYTPYEMPAEAVTQLEECIKKFADVLKTFDSNVKNTNIECENFDQFDRDLNEAIKKVAKDMTVEASNMQNYEDFFIREVKANEEDWRQLPEYSALKGRLDSFVNTEDETKLAIISVHRNKPFVVVKAHPPGRGLKTGLIKGSITGAAVYGIQTVAPDHIREAVQKFRQPLPKELPPHHAFFARFGRGMLGALGGVGVIGTALAINTAVKSLQWGQNIQHWFSLVTSAEKFFKTPEGQKLQQEIYTNFAKSLFTGGAERGTPPSPPGTGG